MFIRKNEELEIADNLQYFKFENIPIKVIEIKGVPMFEIYSTGVALGQFKKNSRGKHYPRKERIDENIKNADIKTCVHNGHKYISEEQLYDFMLEAKTEKCKKFRKWVVTEVLPSIRKHGGYIYGQESMSDEELLSKALLVASGKINERDKVIEQLKPLVEFANQVADTNNLIDMGSMAKLLNDEHFNIGRNRLFAWLRENKILMDNNIPYQKFIDNGYFRLKESASETSYGTNIFTTTYVTGKGQIYIAENLRMNE